jgi:hypothetical protein
MALTIKHPLDTISPSSGTLTIGTTGSLVIAKGSTAQRPVSSVPGAMRYNTDTGVPEIFTGLVTPTWQPIVTGTASSGSDEIGLIIALS